LLLSYPTINKNKHKNHSVPRLIQVWMTTFSEIFVYISFYVR
jgi:hypothetical protein